MEVDMAMRAPGFEGAEEAQAGEVRQGIPDDHPVMVAFRNAPLDDEPMTEGERLAMEEWRANPVGIPHHVVMAELAERAARER